MRRLIPLLFLLGACATLPARPRYRSVSVERDVIAALADLQRSDSLETVVCLTGDERRGKVTIDGTRPALVRDATTTAVYFERCAGGERGVVGWYHNHPPQDWDACAFSPADARVLHKWPRFDVMLVSCERRGAVVFLFQFQGDDESYTLDLDGLAYSAPGDSTGAR